MKTDKTQKWQLQNKENKYSRLERARQSGRVAKDMGRYYKQIS